MKTLLTILFVVCISQTQANFSKALLEERWDNFKQANARTFRSFKEETFRRSLFEKKLQEVEDHNERYRQGLETYEIGINEFSDYTEDELRAYTHGAEIPSNFTPAAEYSFPIQAADLTAVPDSFDWRSRGVVTPVKDQRNCGSCWAFSTNGALEAHYRIRYARTVILSEQQLVDCVSASNGCNGGWMPSAYLYIARNGGINYNGDYPYEAKNGRCRYRSSKPHVSIRGYSYLTRPDENALKNLVATRGPVSVAIDAGGNFAGYRGGVYYNPSCSSTRVTHAVVIVGYGRENGHDYWLVKNSWGQKWGLNGYIKMARNRGNNCAIATYPSIPYL